jgi:hypothetical protein
MQGVAQQRGINMQQMKRDLLVGNWFIVRDEHGRPTKAGRINSKTEEGDYVVRVTFDASAPAYGEIVCPSRLKGEGWLLFTNESSWRTAFGAMQ